MCSHLFSRGCGAVSPCLGPGSTCEEHDNTFTCYCAKVTIIVTINNNNNNTNNNNTVIIISYKGRTGKFCEKVVAMADLVVAGFTGTSLVVVSFSSLVVVVADFTVIVRSLLRCNCLVVKDIPVLLN